LDQEAACNDRYRSRQRDQQGTEQENADESNQDRDNNREYESSNHFFFLFPRRDSFLPVTDDLP